MRSWSDLLDVTASAAGAGLMHHLTLTPARMPTMAPARMLDLQGPTYPSATTFILILVAAALTSCLSTSRLGAVASIWCQPRLPVSISAALSRTTALQLLVQDLRLLLMGSLPRTESRHAFFASLYALRALLWSCSLSNTKLSPCSIRNRNYGVAKKTFIRADTSAGDRVSDVSRALPKRHIFDGNVTRFYPLAVRLFLAFHV